MKLANVTLEMSLKPFRDTGTETMDRVLATLFRQWRDLTARAKAVSVLLWAADGSEILDYTGDPDATFEWAKWIGVANPRWGGRDRHDPEGRSIHKQPALYMADPPEFTYRWLQTLVARIKAKAGELGKPVRVIATFDPGPEFAKSSFKYERHEEICLCRWEGAPSFVCCYGTLKGDTRRYAAYPDGIPDGEPFGRFLGRQAQRFLADLGFDALWLSNGFGFGLETWAHTGALFDGKRFSPARAAETRERILGFWREFTAACAFPIQVRGSNFPTGVDVASDAVPIREIYQTYRPLPPPNSPWAALDGDFGIELGGWMAHVAEIPAASYLFRYYIHDPWFKNSPWLDRYGRESHDIFLPLAVSRIDPAGATATADHLSLLTVDNSFGEMPDQVAREVVPKLLEAMGDAPDAPGPLVWVYPFDEIHDRVAAGRDLDVIFFGDWFACGAINHGLPLNTVVSTGNLARLLPARPALFKASILFIPCGTLADACAEAVTAWVRGGGRALFYGPATGAPAGIRELLGLAAAPPLSGDFTLEINGLELDACAAGPVPAVFRHDPLVGGGGLDAVATPGGGATVRATAVQGQERRAAAVSRTDPAWHGGRAAWVRGSVSGTAGGGQLLTPLDPAANFNPERLPGLLLAEFGWTLRFAKREWGARCPITLVARHDNALFFSGFTPDLTCGLILATPLGAPLFTGTETLLTGGAATYRMPRSWHQECRVFVVQKEGFVACAEHIAIEMSQRRNLLVSGLRNATVRFLPEAGGADQVRFLLNPQHPFLGGDWLPATPVSDAGGDYLELHGVTGTLMIQLRSTEAG